MARTPKKESVSNGRAVSVEGSSVYKSLYSLLGANRAFTDNNTNQIAVSAMLDGQTSWSGGNIWVHYTSLEAAMNAAKDGETIVLEDDVTLTEDVYLYDTSAATAEDMTITLDLNRHTVSGVANTGSVILGEGYYDWRTPSAQEKGYGKLIIRGSGDFEPNILIREKGSLDLSGWTGNTIKQVAVSRYSTFVGTKGTGKIEGLQFGSWYPSGSGNVTLSGGSYDQIWMNSFQEDEEIKLGSLLEQGYAFQETEGEKNFLTYTTPFKHQEHLYNLAVVPCTAHVDADNDKLCDYCNTDVTTSTVATLTVGDATYFYADLAAAFDKANTTGGTITMQKNVTGLNKGLVLGGASNWNDYNITLDLNGTTISGTSSGNTFLKIDTYGTVTICDTSSAKNGRIECTGFGEYAMYVSSGKLTIEAGTFAGTGSDGNALGVNAAALNLTGGTFSSPVNVYNGIVSISGGSFASIWNFNRNSSAAPLSELLAKGYAFADADNNVKDASVNNLTNVHVIDCPHPDVDDSIDDRKKHYDQSERQNAHPR